MKKRIIALTIATLSSPVYAEETSWLDSLKSFIGLGESNSSEKVAESGAEAGVSAQAMIAAVASSLNVNQQQAEGGLASLFNFAKGNISSEQFGQLSSALPGVSDLLNQVPDINQLKSAKGIGGLLDKASEYSESVKAINDVKKQFEALGLTPEMIDDYVGAAQSYLDTEQGQQAKQLFTEGLGKLLS